MAVRVTRGLLAGKEVKKCHHRSMISPHGGTTPAQYLTVIVSLATPTMTSLGGKGEETSEEGVVFPSNQAVLLPVFILGFLLGGYSRQHAVLLSRTREFLLFSVSKSFLNIYFGQLFYIGFIKCVAIQIQ